MKKLTIATVTAILVLISCRAIAREEVREDFKKYFDMFDVEGTFVLYDPQNDCHTFYDRELADKGFIPASTFKIYNSLIGLETGVISDKHHIIPWDKVRRSREVINKDQDLESAFKNSALWYYQELARRVGQEQMNRWIDMLSYGNTDTSAGVDVFWIEGGMRISPIQQVNLLAKLRNNELPFSLRSMDIVREIMISKSAATCTLRTKTGWGDQDGKEVGWYVGYLETEGKVYYFAVCIQPKNTINENFAAARIKIVDLIFNDLGLAKE